MPVISPEIKPVYTYPAIEGVDTEMLNSLPPAVKTEVTKLIFAISAIGLPKIMSRTQVCEMVGVCAQTVAKRFKGQTIFSPADVLNIRLYGLPEMERRGVDKELLAE